ncbi:MAG TPA: hypothetical protein PKK31_02830 [Elusimicrobiales bacterium]|nr:hypothetical protein [Elusimicrobiales bacterium]
MNRMILLPACLAAAALLAPVSFAADLEVPPEPGALSVSRPEAGAVITDLGGRLKLSARQEERISGAIQKQTRDFDTIFKEYEAAAAEEKKWRYRMNETRYRLSLISRGIPDLVREYLDEEQREAFDELLEERRRTLAEMKQSAQPPEKPAEAKPRPKKKVLVRKKKAPSKAKPAPAAPAAPAPAEEPPAPEEEYDDLGSYP